MAVGFDDHGALVEQLSPTPAEATLSPTPAVCVPTKYIARVDGRRIASVRWRLDGRTVTGHTVHSRTRYVAALVLAPGPHRLIVKVRFKRSSHTAQRTFHRTVLGCSSGPPIFTG
jgi:hypothetical protein